MHHILCFIAGIAQCHRARRTMAPSSRRVSSPRPPRRVFFGPPCIVYLVLYVFRHLHFGFDIALNRIETLVIKAGILRLRIRYRHSLYRKSPWTFSLSLRELYLAEDLASQSRRFFNLLKYSVQAAPIRSLSISN